MELGDIEENSKDRNSSVSGAGHDVHSDLHPQRFAVKAGEIMELLSSRVRGVW